jgi:hypothetical protein
MRILADNDVGGPVTALRRVLESSAWIEFTATLDLRFVVFEDVGLARDASDRTVWSRCQEVGAVLRTGNRASGTESLEQTIHDHTETDSLPVVTIGDPQRVVRDPEYTRACAMGLLDLLERLETLRGTGRLCIP